MNQNQGSVHIEQSQPVLISPLHSQENAEVVVPTCAAQCAAGSSAQVPENHEGTENDVRKPLQEISANSGEVQEQEKSTEDNEGIDKLSSFVSKLLEKLANQKSRMSELGNMLENNTCLGEQPEQDADDAEEEEGNGELQTLDDALKENLSPEKRRRVECEEDSHQEKAFSPSEGHVSKGLANFQVEDVLQISRSDIAFGTRLPGQIVEEHFAIVNNSDHDFVVQILISCLNEELQNTDEYIYSIRRSHLYDYNDRHYLIMAPHSAAEFKLALKVPSMKMKGQILGDARISVQGMQGEYQVNLFSHVEIPRIFCPKELACNGLEYQVIKLAIKIGKKQDVKIPIRNQSNVPVTLELDFHEPKSGNDIKNRALFDCMVHPNVINIPANSSALTNVLIKPWKIISSIKELDQNKPARKILIGKVRDSVLVYSFVFWIEIY